MKFVATKLQDAFVLELERHEDERGFFARTWCRDEFADHGLVPQLAQCSISRNSRAGTLRGMHFQIAPHEEAKLVRCTAGAIFDVIIDVRPGSPSFRQWQGFELSWENRDQLYIPEGFAHGFQTLTDDALVNYLISAFYAPEAAAGFRYDDAAFNISWPLAVSEIADKDLAWPAFTSERETAAAKDSHASATRVPRGPSRSAG